MEASQPLRGKRTHQGVEVVCTRNAAFSWETFMLSFRGRATEPVTISVGVPTAPPALPVLHMMDAQLLGESPGTLRSHLSRARKALKLRLEAEGYGPS